MIRALRAWAARQARRRLGVPSIGASLLRLRRGGLVVRRAYDIGAYQGDFTAELLQHWPRAEVVCFEPLDHRLRGLVERFADRPQVLVRGELLGARSDTPVSLTLAETASSVLVEHVNQSLPRVPRTTSALDDLVMGTVPAPADLMKLDVQGYELAVLQGAERTLSGASALVIEVNLLDIHQGVPLLDEIVGWLSPRGFVAWDIAGLIRRPLDQALWQMDVIFVTRASPLRTDKRWST